MRKGLFYTLSIMVLMIPLITLIVFYMTLDSATLDEEVANLRCDQLHYFVEDINRDLSRANMVFGRRAAVYAVDYVISNATTLDNYTFNCTSECAVNCTTYVPPPNGAEAAIAELVLCGTLAGENSTFMINHTLPKWIEKMDVGGGNMNFNTSFTVWDFEVIPYDAFNFSIILNYTLDTEDAGGLCYYRGRMTQVTSITSIEGIEDPLAPLKTEGKLISPIKNCPINVSLQNVLGTSNRGYGNGSGSGDVIFTANFTDPGTYCSTHNVSGKVLVFETAFGSCNQVEQLCFNASAPEGDHFEAVVNSGTDDPQSFAIKCDITIPWISDTTDLNTTDGQCIAIKNIDSCIVHEVLGALEAENINSSCYQESNVGNYDVFCGGPTPNGPSFFDRLEGRLNLSELYVNQSTEYYGNPLIGLESLIDPYALRNRNIDVDKDLTWIDYLYWQDTQGCASLESCAGDYKFRVDCAHSYSLDLDTDCSEGYNIKPLSNITSPAGDFTLYCPDAPLDISGSSLDCDGNVTLVQLGVDNNWAIADGTTTWNYSWTPDAAGHYIVCSRAVDDKGSGQAMPYCLNATVACCGGPPALSTSFATGYPQKTPGNNKPVRVKANVVDQDCTPVTDASVSVRVDGEFHPPEDDVLLSNGGGEYGDGGGTYWQSLTLFDNDEGIQVNVTAQKAGYDEDSVVVYLFTYFI